MNKSVYSYNCAIFPGKLCAQAFNLAFVGWLWYVDAGQHLGACSLNGAIWYNFQIRRGFITLLRLVFSPAIVPTNPTHFARTDSGFCLSVARWPLFTHLFGCAHIPHKRMENSFLSLFRNSGPFFPMRLPPSIACQPLPYCEGKP